VSEGLGRGDAWSEVALRVSETVAEERWKDRGAEEALWGETEELKREKPRERIVPVLETGPRASGSPSNAAG
jgi:hypothetical protein